MVTPDGNISGCVAIYSIFDGLSVLQFFRRRGKAELEAREHLNWAAFQSTVLVDALKIAPRVLASSIVGEVQLYVG